MLYLILLGGLWVGNNFPGRLEGLFWAALGWQPTLLASEVLRMSWEKPFPFFWKQTRSGFQKLLKGILSPAQAGKVGLWSSVTPKRLPHPPSNSASRMAPEQPFTCELTTSGLTLIQIIDLAITYFIHLTNWLAFLALYKTSSLSQEPWRPSVSPVRLATFPPLCVLSRDLTFFIFFWGPKWNYFSALGLKIFWYFIYFVPHTTYKLLLQWLSRYFTPYPLHIG